MSRESPGANRALAKDWVAEFLRITLFHESSDFEATELLWEEVFGNQPEDIVLKPKAKEISVVGKWGGRIAHVQSQPGRMDWFLAAGDDPDLDSMGYADVASAFVGLLDKWKTGVPNVSRLGFGGVVSLASPSAKEAYVTMSDYMTFDLDRKSCSDFMFQINRRRPSGVVDGVIMNRLTKWGVVQSGKMLFSLMNGKMIGTQATDSAGFSCRLELDINTSPELGKTIPADKVWPMLREQCQMALEIIQEGDV